MKDSIFAANCKSIARCVYICSKGNQVVNINIHINLILMITNHVIISHKKFSIIFNNLQQVKKIDVKQIRSTDNFVDLFTKIFPTSTFEN